MAGALTFTLGSGGSFGSGEDFSLSNLAAKRFKLVFGEFAYDAASCSALTVTTAMVGLNDIRGFVASPKGNVFWMFDPSADTVQPIPGIVSSVSATCKDTFNPTASWSVASITSVPFLCWGFE